MKVIYITTYTFPSKRAEPYYIRSMSQALNTALGKDFLLVIRGAVTDELRGIQVRGLNLPAVGRKLTYMLMFPFLTLTSKWSTNETILLSNDPNLLTIFVFWKKVLRFKYRICADWHQLFEDWRDSFLLKNCEYHITTCRRLKERLLDVLPGAHDRILVAYGGIDLTYFSDTKLQDREMLKKELSLPPDAFLVGYVGGFRSVGLEKGQRTMIEALTYLPPTVRMVFVGGTYPEMEEFRKVADEGGVVDRCVFIKKQHPFENVVEYECALDVLVIPYPDKPHFRDYGFPLKVWEYMATGRPIVYSNLAIMNEVLAQKANTFVPDSASSLAETLLHIKANFREVEKMAIKNRDYVTHYTWDKRIQRIIEYFA